MTKNIWLVNPYAVPPEYETRLRTIKTAEYLIKRGFRVTIFGGSFVHNTNINLIDTNEKFLQNSYGSLKFVHIKTSNYKDNGIARFKNLLMFHAGFKKICNMFEKPDIIIHDLSIPFGGKAFKAAKKYKARYIGQVQDLWPESFVSFGLIRRNGLIHKILRTIELKSYRKCDKVIFSMEGGKDYLIKQGWEKKLDLSKIYYLNNGVDLYDFNNNVSEYKLDDEDLNNDDIFKVVYLGSIRLANDIKKLIDAADALKNNDRIKFLIYGDGNERESLIEYCGERHINNVIFKEKKIDIKYVPYVVSRSDLNVLNYMPNDIWQYGGSQSKFFQYLAAGKPIISNLKLGHCMVSAFDCGIAKKFDNGQEYAEAIESFYKMDKTRYDELCQNALEASKQFDYKLLTDKLIEILEI